MKGKFPGCVLSVTMPVTAVDVNVHPAKTQVKFAREREVFDAVYHTVLDALDRDGIPERPKIAETVLPRQDFFQSMDAGAFRQKVSAPAAKGPEIRHPVWDTERRPAAARVADVEKARPLYGSRPMQPERSAPPVVPAGQARPPAASAWTPPRETPRAEREPAPEPPKRPFVPAIPEMRQTGLALPEQQTIEPPKETPWRIAGEVLRTYVICEAEDGTVWLIDKHAAHERINFDRLKAASVPPMRQQLLQPAAVSLGKEDTALLLENLPLLEQFGFGCEDFGGDVLLVREVPSDIDPADTQATVEEFAENLRSGRNPAERRENLLHTMACKAAVKAGMHSDERELRVLVDRVQAGEIKYCPHGRPVAVKLTKYELEKMFKRA
jgi:DNA mismatch repair protein MutL